LPRPCGRNPAGGEIGISFGVATSIDLDGEALFANADREAAGGQGPALSPHPE